jgi:hypothetical protein
VEEKIEKQIVKRPASRPPSDIKTVEYETPVSMANDEVLSYLII